VNLQNTLNATWQATGLQLEVGEKATPFEHRSYGDELQRCKRYFQRFGTGAWFIRSATGTVYSNANLQTAYTLPVAMRATPTTSNSDGSTSVTAQGFNINYSSSPGTREYTGYVDNTAGTMVLGLNYNQTYNSSTTLPTSVVFVQLNDSIFLNAEL